MSGSNGKIISNNSGIHSLAGFAFQIRVFAYYALCISKENEQVEFETLDDIATKISKNNIDTQTDKFRCKALYQDIHNIIQVKRKKLSKDDFRKTLYNWILLMNDSIEVNKYILFTSIEQDNVDLMFEKSANELYDEIIKTKKVKPNAIEIQIKKHFTDKFDDFQKIYNEIKNKYVFINNKSIDDMIFEQGKIHLRYNEMNKSLYKERLEFFMNTIQNEILSSINVKKPYILNTSGVLRIYEDMNTSLNEKKYWPPYYSFQEKLDNISLEDSKIANLRETKQLISCKLTPVNTIERLKQLIYYQHFRTLSAENGKQSTPKSIETTTYNNFQSVLEELVDGPDDTPKKRLLKTEQRNNSYAPNDEIRHGSCIYLTGDNIANQISWEDDSNANH